jgi:GGDEF domain-containing protein
VNFPSPPGVAAHIIELAQDPGIEMGKVAKALSMDSALSSKVLRIANSPLYAQRRKSENLQQALVVLGLNATLTLALSFSLVKSLRGAKPNGLNYKLYWRRALLAATAARALADAMRQTLAEEIFLAALLQDVGMLALDQAVPDLYRDAEKLQRDHAALAVLQATARILRGNTRETDLIARHGGEEFVVVLPATDAETAHNICERIVMAFRNTGHVVGSHNAKVTVSIGCATHGGQIQFSNYNDFVKAADQALYTAKTRGRNRSVPFDRQLSGAVARSG